MDLLIALVVIVIVAALLMWLVYYVPFPPGSPVWIKNAVYVVILLVALIAILYRSGLSHAF